MVILIDEIYENYENCDILFDELYEILPNFESIKCIKFDLTDNEYINIQKSIWTLKSHLINQSNGEIFIINFGIFFLLKKCKQLDYIDLYDELNILIQSELYNNVTNFIIFDRSDDFIYKNLPSLYIELNDINSNNHIRLLQMDNTIDIYIEYKYVIDNILKSIK